MVTRAQMRLARVEADALLSDLGVDQEASVDVFSIIDQLGLWLVFNRLENLLGAVVPSGRGGIMLSTQRGVAVQRYTAAHEIGHWVLDYGEARFDTEDDVYRPGVEREVLAQTFASHLLMPPPLILAASVRYGVGGSRSATPEAVYSMARDIGASYEAVARQLVHLEIIDSIKRDELLRVRPATIKERLGRGHRPSGGADVWPVGLDAEPGNLRVTEGDEVVVVLPENRTTGYQWLTDVELQQRSARRASEPPAITAPPPPAVDQDWTPPAATPATVGSARERALARIPGNAGAVRLLPALPAAAPPSPAVAPREGSASTLTVVDDRFLASRAATSASQLRSQRRALAREHDLAQDAGHPPTSAVTAMAAAGGTGERLLALRSTGEGESTFHLSYSSAFDPTALSVESFVLEVTVKPHPEVLRRRAYLKIDLDGEAEGASGEPGADE